MKKKGVVLLNLGGPDSLEAIEGFLYNLFSDYDIIRIPKPVQKPLARIIAKIRAKRTRHYYELMGGKSPQREQTEEQAKELQKKLGEEYKVVVAMRYWHPFTEEALEELFKEDIEKILLLPMYPQFSRATTGSSFNEFERIYLKLKFPKVPVIRVYSYHDNPRYIKAMVENIKENIPPNYKDHFFLFTAHSLPEYLIREGDPYKEQTEETVRLIMEHFPEVKYALGYQSKVGPFRWLEPSTDKLIERLASEGIKKLVVIPVSFVCEHSETLYEIDRQYRELALSSGIEEFIRVPTLKTHPLFIEALYGIVKSLM